MFEWLGAMFSYDFFVRAFFAGAAVCLCASLLGTHLVLKRFSMIGDGLSHVGFGALAVAAAANLAPLWVAVPVVVLAAFLLLRLQGRSRLGGDVAIALLSAAALAAGVFIVSLTGANFDLSSYLFGSILAVSGADVPVTLFLCAAVFLLYLFCFSKFFAVTFDEDFARACGTRTGLYNTLLSVLCAVVVVLGMRLAGALLISALLVFPPACAMRLARSFRGTVLLSAALSLFCFAAGLVLSFALPVPAGATVVLCNALCFLVCSVVSAFVRRRKKPFSS